MKKSTPLLKGILLMSLAAFILLITDLNNRQKKTRYRGDYSQFQPVAVLQDGVVNPEFKKLVREGVRTGWPGEKMRLALIEYSDSPFTEYSEEGIKDALGAIGLVAETDYLLEIFNAQGDITMLNSIIDLAASKPFDFIITTSTPTLQAACRKLSHKTVVFTTVADPVVAGAGKNFNDHLPNLTGISTLSDFDGMTRLIKTLFPEARRVGTLFCPAEVNSVVNKESLDSALMFNGLKLIAVPVNSPSEIGNATLALISQDIQVICQVIDNITGSAFPQILSIADDNNIPYLTFDSPQMLQGALAAVARDYYQAGTDGVYLLGRIIAGEDPKNIPFQYVSETDILIDPHIADRYHLMIPEEYQQFIIKAESSMSIPDGDSSKTQSKP
jgi:ABC-type uncharacterized transport system substrate-binding protein